MQQELVLFGGTFDPVHNGHLIVARALAERQGFGRVVFVPAAQPPHKTPAEASATDRLAMLRLAISGEAVLDVSDIELTRAGPSYTLDTLRALRRRHGADTKLHWVIGADMLEDLPRWHRAGEVLAEADIIIAVRPPWDRRLDEVFSRLAKEFPPAQIERLRESVVSTPLIDISSTEIRRLVRQGRSIHHLLPEPVGAYIAEHGLYQAARRLDAT